MLAFRKHRPADGLCDDLIHSLPSEWNLLGPQREIAAAAQIHTPVRMPESNRRRTTLIVVILLLLALLLLLLVQCNRPKPVVAAVPSATPASPPATAAAPQPAAATPLPPEVLTPATIQAPPQVGAGAVISVTWTGPNNDADYVTIVRQAKPEGDSGQYTLTRAGSPLTITAPIEPGDDWEIRYVAARSRKVLGRAPLIVTAAGATLSAAASVNLDSPITVTWTGPNNSGDFITLVASDAPDGRYGDYTLTNKGPTFTVTAPPVAGDGELRYVTGQGNKILARRPVKILTPDVTLSAPAEGIAGSNISVNWTGPANQGDYITVVVKTKADGQYGNYSIVSAGTPSLKVKLPMEPGDAEFRYMTGRGAKVLARRPIKIVAAQVTLSAPATAAVNSPIAVTWTGPANEGDYITVVARTAADGQFGNYTLTSSGSPLKVPALKEPVEAELRYMSGQGAQVLARRPITITR